MADPVIPSHQASKSDIKRCQQVVGTFLFYERAVDPILLPALNTLAETQANPSPETMKNINQFLDFVATNPNTKIRYKASDMQLWIDSDAAYLVAPNARSRTAGYFYLSEQPVSPLEQNPPFNVPILVECKLLHFVQSSAAESEIGAIFHNAKTACPLCVTLNEMGHKQGKTPIKTDNSTANKFANNNIKHRFIKHMDMRYHWILDRQGQKQFLIYWRPGPEKHADYFSKHFLDIEHRRKRNKYVTSS